MRRLTLTGEKSKIANTLFTEPDRVSGGAPSQFLELLDFMISFRFTQCDTERAWITMTLTKPAPLGTGRPALQAGVLGGVQLARLP